MKRDIEVMKVWRVPPMGKLVVEVGGQRVESYEQISNPAVRQRVLAAIGELVTFAGGYERLANDGFAPNLRPSTAGGATGTPEEAQARFLSTLEREFRSRSQGAPPQSVMSAEEKLLNAPQQPGPPTLNLVEEIDAVLQRHVERDPEAMHRSIHVRPAPGGGLQIEVDGKMYQRPAEIEDKRVQLLIKMALQEWESQ